MKTRRRLVSAAALSSIVVLGALMPIATGGMHVAAAAVPNEVTNWNRIAADTLVAFPGPAGGAPPALQINMAMTQGAVYDAVNAIEPRHRPYLLRTRFDPNGLEGRRCRDRGVPRPLEHRLDGARDHRVPEQGEPVAGADYGIRRLARRDTGHPVKIARDRGGERRGRRDDRRAAGRRTLRAVTVDAEH